jgi:hypothetical protein
MISASDGSDGVIQPISRKKRTEEEEIMKTMTRKWLGTGVLSLGLLLAAGIPAAAKNARTVNIDHALALQGKNLPAGKYRVEWQTHSPEATVQFLRKGQLVATTEGRVEQRDKTPCCNTVVYDTAPDGTVTLLEIRFAGSNKVLVFNR